jgi:hypothetical protein
MILIGALYVRRDSVYKILDGVDCYDEDRDSKTFHSDLPVIAHPPCRAWGRMSQFSKPKPDEKSLALHALRIVRRNGGVLEHPLGSRLFGEHAPKSGESDDFGFTLCVDQHWFGHKAEKRTLLYICGLSKKQIPPFVMSLSYPDYVVRPSKNGTGAKIITKAEREQTPMMFATWLVKLARKCNTEKLAFAC